MSITSTVYNIVNYLNSIPKTLYLIIFIKNSLIFRLMKNFLLEKAVELANGLMITGHEFSRYKAQIPMVKVLFLVGMQRNIGRTHLKMWTRKGRTKSQRKCRTFSKVILPGGNFGFHSKLAGKNEGCPWPYVGSSHTKRVMLKELSSWKKSIPMSLPLKTDRDILQKVGLWIGQNVEIQWATFGLMAQLRVPFFTPTIGTLFLFNDGTEEWGVCLKRQFSQWHLPNLSIGNSDWMAWQPCLCAILHANGLANIGHKLGTVFVREHHNGQTNEEKKPKEGMMPIQGPLKWVGRRIGRRSAENEESGHKRAITFLKIQIRNGKNMAKTFSPFGHLSPVQPIRRQSRIWWPARRRAAWPEVPRQQQF